MKCLPNQPNRKNRLWAFLKKAWQCIWNSGGSIQDCPGGGKSAQDIRDERRAKCPWKGDLF